MTPIKPYPKRIEELSSEDSQWVKVVTVEKAIEAHISWKKDILKALKKLSQKEECKTYYFDVSYEEIKALFEE